MPPLVALVGRPNVGKSTIFNRLVGKKKAVVAKEAGTTRDRLQQDITINNKDISFVDTGGLEFEEKRHIVRSAWSVQSANRGVIHLICC